MKLDDESAKLTTLTTPFGNYCFHRLPFGLNISSQVWQKTLSYWFHDGEGVEVYINGPLIHAPDIKILKSRIRAVLHTTREKNLRLNKDKCILKENEVKYSEVLINADGKKTNQERISLILSIDTKI